jgi:hypothetical protein
MPQLRIAVSNMGVYLANKETERILFRPIKVCLCGRLLLLRFFSQRYTDAHTNTHTHTLSLSHPSCQGAVLETHAKMVALLSAAYTQEERDVIACPSMDEIALSLTLEVDVPSPGPDGTPKVLSASNSSTTLAVNTVPSAQTTLTATTETAEASLGLPGHAASSVIPVTPSSTA